MAARPVDLSRSTSSWGSHQDDAAAAGILTCSQALERGPARDWEVDSEALAGNVQEAPVVPSVRDTGQIRIGGRELHELGQEETRSLLSVVPQDVHLFNATIEDDLAVVDADADAAAMERACRIAQLHDFIAALPDGYETVIGENGLLLSGGERRRLAIARAVLKDAPVVILDEASADLDATTEAELWSAMGPWLVGKTVLVISHRPTVATHVDRVVELPTQR